MNHWLFLTLPHLPAIHDSQMVQWYMLLAAYQRLLLLQHSFLLRSSLLLFYRSNILTDIQPVHKTAGSLPGNSLAENANTSSLFRSKLIKFTLMFMPRSNRILSILYGLSASILISYVSHLCSVATSLSAFLDILHRQVLFNLVFYPPPFSVRWWRFCRPLMGWGPQCC